MLHAQGDTCCWTCDRCDPWEYVENEFKCADCGPGRWPYDDKRGCFELEMQYMRWDSLLAIVPLCVACCGIMLTVAVIVIFVRHSETPIVKVKSVLFERPVSFFSFVARASAIAQKRAGSFYFYCWVPQRYVSSAENDARR